MAMELIDGFAGAPHISGQDLAALNQGCFGDGDYVFEYGNNLAATVTNANTVQIGTGALVSKGRRSVNLAAQQLTIQSGTQGQKRNDLVVARYSKASGTNVESTTLAVVKGTPVSYGDAADPDVTANDMKLWRIPIDGITPGTPVQLFEVMKPMSELWDSVSRTTESVTDASFVLKSGEATNRTLSMPGGDGFEIDSVMAISTGNDHVHLLGFSIDGCDLAIRIVNMHSEGVWAQPRVTVSLRKA